MDARVALHSRDGQWSQPLTRSTRVLRCDPPAYVATLLDDGRVVRSWPDPLEALHWMSETTTEPGDQWIGYLSYDLGRWFEELPHRAEDDLKLPLFAFAFVPGDAPQLDPVSLQETSTSGELRSTFTRPGYLRAVERAIEYIRQGDVFQVNLSQRFTTDRTGPAEVLYRRMVERTPARYGALLDFGDFALVSHSPELFLRADFSGRRVLTRPIKGTRPNRPGMGAELLNSAKDAAELNMIIDLERNDLGRVCRTGSVRVTEPRKIESHPTVLHGVATVEGVLRDGVTFVDLLRATFPGGSVTGAPKIRAMQIIDELEPVARGPYCGAIGWIAPRYGLELNVAIRTIILKNNQAHIPAGGGIVADSDPQAEYEETILKARAMIDTLRRD